MPANNSQTNKNIRRASALERFKIDPTKTSDKDYMGRKEAEKAALSKARH